MQAQIKDAEGCVSYLHAGIHVHAQLEEEAHVFGIRLGDRLMQVGHACKHAEQSSRWQRGHATCNNKPRYQATLAPPSLVSTGMYLEDLSLQWPWAPCARWQLPRFGPSRTRQHQTPCDLPCPKAITQSLWALQSQPIHRHHACYKKSLPRA